MIRIFHENDSSMKCWMKLSDINPSIVEAWRRLTRLANISPDSFALQRISRQRLSEKIVENIQMIEYTRRELEAVQPNLASPCLFILTDAHGTALHLQGQQEIVLELKKSDIGEGTSFAMTHAGINAISVAMRIGETAAVRGNEHWLRLFHSWSCVCAPVRAGKQICGFLDMSFAEDTDVTFVVPLIKHIVQKVEEKLTDGNPEFQKKAVFESFDAYGMTAREKEIGYLWLNNEAISSIAAKLFISQETVRTTIKKVYKKAGVCGRIELINKFRS